MVTEPYIGIQRYSTIQHDTARYSDTAIQRYSDTAIQRYRCITTPQVGIRCGLLRSNTLLTGCPPGVHRLSDP
eukprot:1857378-Prymnesium_polylepis.3